VRLTNTSTAHHDVPFFIKKFVKHLAHEQTFQLTPVLPGCLYHFCVVLRGWSSLLALTDLPVMTRGTQPPARHIRQRKLLPKQPLQIIREEDVEPDAYQELLRILESQNSYETGVEKSEENVSCHIFRTCASHVT